MENALLNDYSIGASWALTSGLCSNQQDYRWMRERVGEIESGPTVQSAFARFASPGASERHT